MEWAYVSKHERRYSVSRRLGIDCGRAVSVCFTRTDSEQMLNLSARNRRKSDLTLDYSTRYIRSRPPRTLRCELPDGNGTYYTRTTTKHPSARPIGGWSVVSSRTVLLSAGNRSNPRWDLTIGSQGSKQQPKLESAEGAFVCWTSAATQHFEQIKHYSC